MDVDHPKLAVAGIPKAVNHSYRYGHPCSRPSPDDVIAERELGLSVENIERINVVRVAVWVNAESRTKAGIDDLELRQVGEDSAGSAIMEDLLSLVGGDVDAGHRRSISAVRQECGLPRTSTTVVPGHRLDVWVSGRRF
jgi:hypothetical protein